MATAAVFIVLGKHQTCTHCWRRSKSNSDVHRSVHSKSKSSGLFSCCSDTTKLQLKSLLKVMNVTGHVHPAEAILLLVPHPHSTGGIGTPAASGIIW